MGIKNFWKLIHPSSTQVNLESLRGLILAIDVHIWLNQFSKAQTDHIFILRGIFKRILKLLFYKIKPIFVFDGPGLESKRMTLQKRKNLRDKNAFLAKTIAKKLLLRHLVLNQQSNNINNENPTDNFLADIDSLIKNNNTDIIKEKLNDPEYFSKLPISITSSLSEYRNRNTINANNLNKNYNKLSDFSNSQIDKILPEAKFNRKVDYLRSIPPNNMNDKLSSNLNNNIKETDRDVIQRIVKQSLSDSSHQLPIISNNNTSLSKSKIWKCSKCNFDNLTIIKQCALCKTPQIQIPDSNLTNESITIPDSTLTNESITNNIQNPSFQNLSSPPISIFKSIKQNLETYNNSEDLPSGEDLISSQPEKVFDISLISSQQNSFIPIQNINNNNNTHELALDDTISTQLDSNIELEDETIISTSSDSSTPIQNNNNNPHIIQELSTTLDEIIPTQFDSNTELKDETISMNPEASYSSENEIDRNKNNSFHHTNSKSSSSILSSVNEINNESEDKQPMITLTQEELENDEILLNQLSVATKHASAPTIELIDDVKHLLDLLGLPFIDAPAEAEAQCAVLDSLNVVDGVVTDDSDVFLFGASHVYYHLFSKDNPVLFFNIQSISEQFHLDRKKLVDFSFLVGNDYYEGVKGIGPINAMEIMLLYHSLESFISDIPTPLSSTSNPMKTKIKRAALSWNLPEKFPLHLRNYYLNPLVISNKEELIHFLRWEKPDSNSITVTLNDSILDFMKRMNFDDTQIQFEMKIIDAFYEHKDEQRTLDNFLVNSNNSLIRNKRIQKALGISEKKKKNTKRKFC